MVWTPPAEADFNEEWYRPAFVLEEAVNFCSDDTSARLWVWDRLSLGTILAVARTGPMGEAFIRVQQAHWKAWDQSDDHFWKIGDLALNIPTDATGYNRSRLVYLDVRFDPSHIASHPHPSVKIGSQVEPIAESKPLPATEYANLARAIWAGWGMGLSEADAWTRAKDLFPNHNVRRKEFLAQFRRERGTKNPGKQPLR